MICHDQLKAEESPLGKEVQYPSKYNNALLFPIERANNRKKLGITSTPPFHGVDLWTAYELSWLNSRGKPVAFVGQIVVPCMSKNLIESKSLKLYFNSFNQTVFESATEVKKTIEKDLSKATETDVTIHLIPVKNYQEHVYLSSGICLDSLDVEISTYTPDPSLLAVSDENGQQQLYTHLFKSNCPVTRQPDWATVSITYSGQTIIHQSLLQYLVSYRNHEEFHEQCAERIFMDITKRCNPEKLTVYLQFTRRGGIDINPFRSNFESPPKHMRLVR